jgi:hypothetical protein
MANKHEEEPTALKPPSEFRETVKIGSASSWDKVTLELFHVAFKKTQYTELRGSKYLHERYFEAPPENEKCYRGTILNILLIVGYLKIMRSLEDARPLDIPSIGKEDLVVALEDNPLCEFFVLLRDFMVGPSAEAMELRQEKNRSRTPSPKKRSKISDSQKSDSQYNDNEIQFLPEIPSSQIPSSQITVSSFIDTTTPVKKRNISGGSFGPQSTDSSPAKLSQAEQYTQNLQSTLIAKLINCVWRGEATVAWAENRKMYLEYRPYSQTIQSILIVVISIPLFVAAWKEITAMLMTVSSPIQTVHSQSSRIKSPVQIGLSFGVSKRPLLRSKYPLPSESRS